MTKNNTVCSRVLQGVFLAVLLAVFGLAACGSGGGSTTNNNTPSTTPTTYTITASTGSGGTVTPSGATTVTQGASQSYTITPIGGYAIATLVVDGTTVATSATHTFTNVQANHTISATFSGGSGGGDCRGAPAPPTPSTSISGDCVADASTEYLTANYYVDVATGSDANSGLAAGAAWKTLGKALSSAPSGSVVHVASGDYGILQETSGIGRTNYLTIRATPGTSPRLSRINITYGTKAPAFLRVVGFTIKNYNYNPNNTQLVNISYATDIELLNNTINSDSTRGSGYAIASATPGQPYTIDGVRLSNTDRVILKSNCVSAVTTGMQILASTDISILRNYISPQSGTGIHYLSYNSNVLVEDNHIRGMSYTPYCTFATLSTPKTVANCVEATPLDSNALVDPHASVISVRSNDLTVRNNIMHGMGTSSGIMFYAPDLPGVPSAYSNITIEGNLMYDISNDYVLRIYGAADNLVIRNNMLISRYTTGSCTAGSPIGVTEDARYRFSTAFIVHSLAAGRDGSGIKLANNIFVGIAFLGGALAVDKNNIFWSYAPTANTFSASSLSGTSKVVTSTYSGCGNHVPYFETGFFAAAPNFIPQHGLLYDYKPATTSEAVGFGDSTTSMLRKLGTLDANNFFINDGGDRCTGEHSAGPYEP